MLVAILAAGCGGEPTVAADGQGQLAVSWSGRHDGKFAAQARATWCAADSMVQVFAIAGDTGVGLALYTPDTIRATQYPVIWPEVVVPWRPLGAVALRWVGETDLIGYEAVTGVITVTSVDSGLSASLDVGLRAPGGTDTLRMAGGVTGLRIEPADGACGRFNKIPPPKEGS